MAVRDIIEIPSPKLRVQYQKVQQVAAVQGLIDDLLDTMYSTETGVGLAAPQIGHADAVVVIDISEQRDQPMVLINPEIIAAEDEIMSEEGCLSVPGISAQVKRYAKVTVRALNRDGEEIIVQRDDFLAIVMQHELDHLHGRIFIDYLSPLKREMAMKKIAKIRKQEQRNR
ncbi:peptide deformylase [Acinetobacter calcoaceticus]|uniref:Peptide deformylase n=1 Tax=Acinetobacter calcoaceticus TaxID=471 RepID=A0A4R1XG74_ACICA|nr:peptide deformylase [Acinetobacter calcoaceticus]